MFCRDREGEKAWEKFKDLEPTSPQEYIVKAIVYTVHGQEQEFEKRNLYLKEAQKFFRLGVISSLQVCRKN